MRTQRLLIKRRLLSERNIETEPCVQRNGPERPISRVLRTLYCLQSWQIITHLFQVNAHSGSILGLDLPVGTLIFVQARAVLVKTNVQDYVLSTTYLPVFSRRPKQEQRNSHSYL